MLAAHDAACRLRDAGVTVISGFHSPVEQECLRILLGGKQPIILALPRSLAKIRVPKEWRAALDQGRLLLFSPSAKRPRRPDKHDARRRNEIVAALADEILIVHAEPGGSIERIAGWRGNGGFDQLRLPPAGRDCRESGR
jgi:predicted Rossmann fold nucleotide-binding protein DprA/Smf involved in DNA uptake